MNNFNIIVCITTLFVTVVNSNILQSDILNENDYNICQLLDKDITNELLRLAQEESKVGTIEAYGIADEEGIFLLPKDDQVNNIKKDNNFPQKSEYYYIDWDIGWRQYFRKANLKGRVTIVNVSGILHRTIPVSNYNSLYYITDISSIKVLCQPLYIEFLLQNSCIITNPNMDSNSSTKLDIVTFIHVYESYYDILKKRVIPGKFCDYFCINNKSYKIEGRMTSRLKPLALAAQKRQNFLKIGITGNIKNNTIIPFNIDYVRVEKQTIRPFPIANNIDFLLASGQRVIIMGRSFVDNNGNTFILLKKNNSDSVIDRNIYVMYELCFSNSLDEKSYISQGQHSQHVNIYIEGDINYNFFTGTFIIENTKIISYGISSNFDKLTK